MTYKGIIEVDENSSSCRSCPSTPDYILAYFDMAFSACCATASDR